MDTKTNFAFLNREDFLKHPACREIYLYATQSERFFLNNEDLCAINARRFTEIFIRFVSFELKKASYPDDCLCIGSYYHSGNKPEFYKVFGVNNAELIIQLNDATKPYFHPAMKKDEELYRVVVRNIFNLSWWLYTQLYPGEKSKMFGDYIAAIMPEDLCEGIDNNSTLDDFIKILGSDPKQAGMRVDKTEMSTAEKENGWLFQLNNYDAVLCFFDDEGKLCDYLYLYIAEGRDRELP
ncbi:MAG: hypothetical protein K5686_10175 [Lachnospiraceae bacterium]|nr:hypothetical protein [Lachnospiraceae bacterium]